MNWSDQTVVITGASRGIGAALAQTFARQHTHLHLLSRQFSVDPTKELLGLGAKSVRLWPVDLGQKISLDQFVAQILSDKIKVDVLINNAGLLTGGLLEEQDPEDIEAMFDVNVKALVRLTRLFLPGMLERRRGKIINNASVVGHMHFPCASTYSASKAAVIAFTESLRQELSGTGVSTLLMITPGVQTKMYNEIETLYGGHLQLTNLGSIPAEDWAMSVLKAASSDQATLMPSGFTRFGVFLGQHFHSVLEDFVRTRFKR